MQILIPKKQLLWNIHGMILAALAGIGDSHLAGRLVGWALEDLSPKNYSCWCA